MKVLDERRMSCRARSLLQSDKCPLREAGALGHLGFGGTDYGWQIRAGLESWQEWPHWRPFAGKHHACGRADITGPWPGRGIPTEEENVFLGGGSRGIGQLPGDPANKWQWFRPQKEEKRLW